jgi:sister chromatid cohesion protein PDS5
MKILLRRASLRVVNQSSIPTLLKRVQKGDPTGDGHGTSQAQLTANHAHALLTMISKHLPILYKPHISELCKGLAEENNPRLVEVCLQALAGVAGKDPSLAPSDKKTAERIHRLVMSSNTRHSKFSARLLTTLRNAEQACQEVISVIDVICPVICYLTLLLGYRGQPPRCAGRAACSAYSRPAAARPNDTGHFRAEK